MQKNLEGVSCPQCGNPNLDVDAQNNVVYCKQCGFAVQVDPATGNVTPLSQGGAGAQAPAAYAGGPSGKTILGTDPLTFFLLVATIVAILYFMQVLDETLAFAAIIIAFIYYWYNK